MVADRAPRPHYGYIDGLRAVAVLAVVCFHVVVGESVVRGRLLPGIEQIGTRGVDLFFVLSGFCLSLPYLRRARATGVLEIDYGEFLSRRFARIAPPYYVALAAFTLLASTPFGYPSTWATSVAALDNAGAREFVPDLAFMTTSLPVANTSFWTLGIEMRWYLVCPLLIALFWRSRVAFAAVMLATYALYYALPSHVLDAGTLPAFMLGIVAAHLTLAVRRIGVVAIVAACALLTLAMLQQARTLQVDHGSPLWHLACFAVIVAARAELPARVLAWRPLVLTGGASYSIYLVHQPLIVWLGRHGVPWVVAGALATGIGIVFWALVERRFLQERTRETLAGGLRRLFRRYTRPPIVVPARGSW